MSSKKAVRIYVCARGGNLFEDFHGEFVRNSSGLHDVTKKILQFLECTKLQCVCVCFKSYPPSLHKRSDICNV